VNACFREKAEDLLSDEENELRLTRLQYPQEVFNEDGGDDYPH
jgi:hypothetical protein